MIYSDTREELEKIGGKGVALHRVVSDLVKSHKGRGDEIVDIVMKDTLDTYFRKDKNESYNLILNRLIAKVIADSTR